MKIPAALFISLFFISNILSGQQFCVKVEDGLYFPSLSHVKGDISNCNLIAKNVYCPDIGVEYKNSFGVIFSATVGYQKEQLNFSEISNVYTYGGPLNFAKVYKSIPVIFSSGYSCRIGESHFRFNALAGIGFGIVRAQEVKLHYSFDGDLVVVDQQGQNHLDSQHVLVNVVDESLNKPIGQARISVALEYDAKRFFVRSFFEARSWLSSFEEIGYHSERSSTFYQFAQTLDGKFSVRTGYFGVGIGVGWHFNSSEK